MNVSFVEFLRLSLMIISLETTVTYIFFSIIIYLPDVLNKKNYFVYSLISGESNNPRTTMIVNHVFEGISLFFSATSFLISVFTLILIFIYIRPFISNVPILLTCNTYITVIGSSFMTLLVLAFGVYDSVHPSISLDDYYCQLRSYINYVFICAFYYSCALQAMFRLFRVVFPKHKILQSSGMFLVAILVQWLIPIFYILAYLLLGDFQYQPDIGSCWLSFKNIPALSIAMAFVYGTPLIIMSVIYACIIRYIRQTVQIQQIRQQANKRDLLIVKRMIMLVLIAMGIGIPTGVLLIIYMITNYLISLAYHIQALSLTTGLILESVALGFITPQVREMFKRNRQQVNPIATVGTVPQGLLPSRVFIS